MTIVLSSSATGTTSDRPDVNHHRHVSLANIATAFLSERKNSSRRQTSIRRKKRVVNNERRTSRRQSNYSGASEKNIGQRVSMDRMNSVVAATLVVNSVAVGGNSKNRTTTVRKCFYSSYCLGEC
jgi:hypothetical protein